MRACNKKAERARRMIDTQVSGLIRVMHKRKTGAQVTV